MTLRASLILILVVLLVAAGVFLWFRSTQPQSAGQPTSPVLVDILLPQSGASLSASDPISVLAQAWSPSPLTALQLWMDGEMVAVENVESDAVPHKASWEIEAGPGVHTFFVKATDEEGNEGQSQSLIINAIAGQFAQVSAEGGQTLEELSAASGVPVSDLQSFNPGVDPQKPLEDGQQIIVPPSPITEDDQPAGEGTGGPELVIHWQFTPLDQVDKSYCYQSLGGDSWQKIPADPFSFFPGNEWLQNYSPTGGQPLELLMQCWGWQGGTLKYLGEGQTNLDYAQIPDELVILGPGFQMDGLPEQKPLGGGGLPDVEIPAPFALRLAKSVNECATHYGENFWANVICDGLMNGQVKQYEILVWEWSPGFCWGTCPWGDGIDGYQVSQSAPYSGSGAPVFKDIPTPDQKVTSFPLPWGPACYAVRAYVNIVGGDRVYSAPAVNCGEPPEPQKVVLTPSNWLTSEGMWINEDCDNWADAARLKPTGSQVVVGFFLFADDEYCDIKQGSATAAVKFNNIGIQVPQAAIIQRAILRFKQVGVEYSGPFDVALGNFVPTSCATRVGKAKSDWTGLSGGHFINPDTLGPYYLAYTSIGWDLSADVTSAILGWMDNTSSNHGFVLIADSGDLVNNYTFESGWDIKICYSQYDNIELEIQFFAPN